MLKDLLFELYTPQLKNVIAGICDMYKDKKYTINEFKENNELVGVLIYHIENDAMIIDELGYKGNNKYIALKIYKIVKRLNKKTQGQVLKANDKMLGFVLNILKCKIVREEPLHFIIEKERW